MDAAERAKAKPAPNPKPPVAPKPTVRVQLGTGGLSSPVSDRLDGSSHRQRTVTATLSNPSAAAGAEAFGRRLHDYHGPSEAAAAVVPIAAMSIAAPATTGSSSSSADHLTGECGASSRSSPALPAEVSGGGERAATVAAAAVAEQAHVSPASEAAGSSIHGLPPVSPKPAVRVSPGSYGVPRTTEQPIAAVVTATTAAVNVQQQQSHSATHVTNASATTDVHTPSKLTRGAKPPPRLTQKPVVVARRQRSDSSSDAAGGCVPSSGTAVAFGPPIPAAACTAAGKSASAADRRSLTKSLSFRDQRTSSAEENRRSSKPGSKPVVADGSGSGGSGVGSWLPFRAFGKGRSPPPPASPGVSKPLQKPTSPQQSASFTVTIGRSRDEGASHSVVQRSRSHGSYHPRDASSGTAPALQSSPDAGVSPTPEVGVRNLVHKFAQHFENVAENRRATHSVGQSVLQSPKVSGTPPVSSSSSAGSPTREQPALSAVECATVGVGLPIEPVGNNGHEQTARPPDPQPDVPPPATASMCSAILSPPAAVDAAGYMRPRCMHVPPCQAGSLNSPQLLPSSSDCSGNTAMGDRKSALSAHHYSDIGEGDSTSKSSTLVSGCSSIHIYEEVAMTSTVGDDDQSSTCSAAGGDHGGSNVAAGRRLASDGDEADVFCDHFDSVLDSCIQSVAEAMGDSSSDTDSDRDEVSEQSVEDKKKRKARLVAQEMMNSEAEFCDNLKLLNEDFRKFVTSGSDAETNPIVPGKMLDRILNYLPQLQDFSSLLKADLEQRVSRWDSNPQVADVFIKMGPFLKLYTTYIVEFERSTAALDEAMKTYPAFAEKVREFEATERCRHLLLRHYMLKPVQRIPQYKLLLTDYLKYVTEEFPDHANAVEALAVVSKVAGDSNEAMKQDDNLRELLDIQSSLVGDFKVIEPSRKLLKRGELLKHSRHDKQARMFFLFNDVLLIASPIGNMFKQKYALRLEDLKTSKPVVDKDDYESEFTIINRQKSFAVVARSATARDAWFDAINRAIEDRREKLQSFLPGVQSPYSRDIEETAIGEVAPVWIPDARVSMCMMCNQQFTMLFRRHHCRGCGKVVCKQCSECKAPLKYSDYGTQRVCVTCYNVLYSRLVDCYEKTLASEGPQLPSKETLVSQFRGPTTAPPPKTMPTRLVEVSADDAHAFSGYLRILTKKFHWKRFWFVVKDHVLYWYNASQDTAAIDSTVLFGYEVDGFTEPFESAPAEFLLKLHKPNTTIIEPVVFRAESADGAARWLAVLQQNTRP